MDLSKKLWLFFLIHLTDKFLVSLKSYHGDYLKKPDMSRYCINDYNSLK